MTAYFPDRAVWAHDRLLNAPSWITDQYDIDAKVSPSEIAEWQKQGADKTMLREMLQAVLAERCKLVVHHVLKDTQIYALTVDPKRGAKLATASPTSTAPSGSVRLPSGGAMVPFQGGSMTPEITFFATPMKALADFLSHSYGYPVEDRTGLTNLYNFVLKKRDAESTSDDSSFASPWQLNSIGLQVRPVRTAMDTIVIDHIDRPSPN